MYCWLVTLVTHILVVSYLARWQMVKSMILKAVQLSHYSLYKLTKPSPVPLNMMTLHMVRLLPENKAHLLRTLFGK